MTTAPDSRELDRAVSTPIDRSGLNAIEAILPLLEPLTDKQRLFVLRTVWEFVITAPIVTARNR